MTIIPEAALNQHIAILGKTGDATAAPWHGSERWE